MAKDKTYNKVQLDVKFTQASTRANLTSEENISIAFGKMSKWYEALVPTGGSSGQFLGWNSDGTAKWVSNPNSDTKVNVTLATTSKAFLLGTTTTPTSTAAGVTSVADTGVYLGTTAGSLYATSFYENGTALSSKYAAIYHTHGLLNSSFIQYADENNSKTGWSILGIDETVNGYILKSLRDNTTNTDWMSGGYGSGIVFGGGDTKGVISMRYNSPIITFAAGNHNSTNTGPDWYIKITGTSGNTYNFNNYMGAVKIGNYYGMAWPDGKDKGDNTWIRTTRLGLIPYAANTDTTYGNVTSLGTSTWTFANGYINNLYYKDLKNVTVVAGSTAANGIDKMTGSFFFAGDNLIGGINDWVGIQAGSSVDKWQIVGSGTRLLYRQNDVGGTDSDNWGKWNGLMSPDSIVGNSGISITKLKYSYGSDDIDVGVYIGHTNSVTAQTDYNKQYVKYDTEGHITESSHFVHLATGTGGVAGWIKLATMKHTRTYDNTPIELTIAQRGSQLTYRLHIKFKNTSSTDPDIDKFVIAVDDDEYASRAYIIKTDTSTWDLYIRKIDSYEALAVTRFSVGKYFTDHMEWIWKDEQVADSEIVDGVEATRYLITHFRQSDTSTENYRPIVMGATQSNDTSRLNATITGQGYVSNSVFVKPSNGYLYANVFSTSSYLNDTGAQLTYYGLYAKSYKEAALPAGGDYSCSGYVIRVHDGKAADNTGMLLTIGSGGLTIVGGGESATNLSNLISDDQRDSNTSRTRLDLGGTLNTSLNGSSEQLVLASDGPIAFVTNCNTIANRKPVMLDSSTQFYPGTTLTGSIGTSSYYWNDAYFNNLYLSNQAYLSRSSSGGTYYRADRTDTNTRVSFGIGDGGINHGIYSYTLNGWIVNGDDSKVYIRSTMYNPSTTMDLFAIPFFGATPSTGSKAIYNNNGLRYSTREGTTSQPGIARLVIGNGVASTSDANKEGSVRIYSASSSYIDLIPESTFSAQTITIPAVTATMAVNRKSLIFDETSDFASYAWHKFADITLTTAYYDYDVTFLASITWGSNLPRRVGVLTMHVRTSSTKIFENGQLTWNFVGVDVDPNDFVMLYYNTANTSCKVELWYKQKARYDGYTFTVLNENTRTIKEIYTMNLYDEKGHGDAELPDATGTIVSTLERIKNAPGIYNVIGTQTASTSAWTGKINVSELYNGLTIAYYLPYASTSTAVTLNLTLVDGTTTGAINCYVNNNSRLTSHYGAGSTIILTYWSAGSIKVSGTATSDNRWSRCEQNTNTNVTQGFATANTNRSLLMSYYGVGNTTTTAQVVYRNDAIYANPSQGAIHAKKLVLGTPYSVDTPGVKGVITLYQAGSEILPAANIEAESGTGGHTDSTIKIPTDRSGVVRLEEIIYSVTVTPTSGTIISDLTFSYGTPRYLKICTRIGSTYANGVTNIFDIGLNTDVGNGVILTWGTPGQSGVSTYIQYANVRISAVNGKYSINFLTGSAMQLTTGSTPLSATAPNIYIYEVIAVY